MGQQVQPWGFPDGGRAWLSRLSRPWSGSPRKSAPVLRFSDLAAVAAQLARPAIALPYAASEFSCGTSPACQPIRPQAANAAACRALLAQLRFSP